MNIIEQATKRLKDLNNAGVAEPRTLPSLAQSELQSQAESNRRAPSIESTPTAAIHSFENDLTPRGDKVLRQVRSVSGAQPAAAVTLDLKQLERSGILVPAQAKSALSEEFRQIKRPLLINARSPEAAANRLSLIAVTSALPGEGKTHCAINLAMSMAAEIDMSVLLVDADVIRPAVLQRLGIEAERGLLDLLTDPNLSLAEVVLTTNIPKLSILPSGRRNNLSTELFASETMKDLLILLANSHQNQVVIFDAPPLLVTSEAKVLASRVGQVVMVVEASKTQRSTAAQAFASVEHCPIVMSILNKAHERTGSHAYGYYYR